MSSAYIIDTAKIAFTAAVIFAVIGMFSFFVLEPSVGRTQAIDTFTVTQTITDEISFLVAAADVAMDGSISGLTGGYATGTTFAVVQTNDPDGYTMTMAFSTGTAMQGNTTTGVINNYTPAATSAPDFNWVDNAGGGAAEFGYTVSASTTADLDQSFLDNGSACNTGSSDAFERCWQNPSTTAETIINRTSGAAPTGATTTIKFKVAVPNGPSPTVPADTYVATATLTATNL